MRRDLLGLVLIFGFFVALPLLLLGGVWLSTAGAVEEARALEDRAIAYIERLRAPELELLGGYARLEEGDIRRAAVLRWVPGGDVLAFFVWGDSGAPWEPGSGVTVAARFRSTLPERATCRLIARTAGVEPSACVGGDGEAGERPYEARLNGEGVEASVEVYERRLMDASGEVDPEASVVADVSVRACGAQQGPGLGSCP